MSPILRIKDWSRHFENNRSREVKSLMWVAMPNKMDGDGYTQLIDHPDGASHFGAWCAIVEIASRCETRGTLMRDSRTPYDSTSLSRRSRLPAAIFDSVIPRLVKIGWLETVGNEHSSEVEQNQTVMEVTAGGCDNTAGGCAPPLACACAQKGGMEGMEGNGIQEENSAALCPSAAASDPPVEIPEPPKIDPGEAIYDAYPRHVGKRKALTAIADARKRLCKAGGTPDAYEHLLDRTQVYAACRQKLIEADPAEVQFTPLPATWFNQGRYDDDPAEWDRGHGTNGRGSGSTRPKTARQADIDETKEWINGLKFEETV